LQVEDLRLPICSFAAGGLAAGFFSKHNTPPETKSLKTTGKARTISDLRKFRSLAIKDFA
jgi:hypothetical protein